MQTVFFDSIQQVNDFYGVPTLHPMVSILHLDRAEAEEVTKYQVHYGIYAICTTEATKIIFHGKTSWRFTTKDWGSN